jgi:hypothetical protein
MPEISGNLLQQNGRFLVRIDPQGNIAEVISARIIKVGYLLFKPKR